MSLRLTFSNGFCLKSFLYSRRRNISRQLFVTPSGAAICNTNMQILLSQMLSSSSGVEDDKKSNELQKDAKDSTGNPNESLVNPVLNSNEMGDSHLDQINTQSDTGRGRVIPTESTNTSIQVPPQNIEGSGVILTTRMEHRPMYIPQPDDEVILTEEDLVPPTNCCMSGCPSCVWIQYVEKLTKFYSNPEIGKERIHRDIEQIEDVNIKACLIMDLKIKGLW